MPEAAGAEWTGLTQEQPNHRLLIEFFMETVEDPLKFKPTKDGGMLDPGDGVKHYHEEEFIRIIVPGDRDNVIVRPVRPVDRTQFAQAYAAFKNKQSQPTVGTLLSLVPFITKPQVMEFATVNIKTAEQLVECSDSIGQQFMGINNLKKRVRDWLDNKAGAGAALKLQNELDKRDAEIAENRALTESLKKTLEEQQKRIEELMGRKK